MAELGFLTLFLLQVLVGCFSAVSILPWLYSHSACTLNPHPCIHWIRSVHQWLHVVSEWEVWVYLPLLPEQMALCNGRVTPTGFLFFTVCKSCIVRHFYYSNRCPKCNIVVHQTQPLYNIR